MEEQVARSVCQILTSEVAQRDNRIRELEALVQEANFVITALQQQVTALHQHMAVAQRLNQKTSSALEVQLLKYSSPRWRQSALK